MLFTLVATLVIPVVETLHTAVVQMFKDKLVEVLNQDTDYVWIHDYHLMVLPSMLRKQFLRLRCGLFLHSPFPSSEIFRTFPMRDQILRSLLNADLLGDQSSLYQSIEDIDGVGKGSSIGQMIGRLCNWWWFSLPLPI